MAKKTKISKSMIRGLLYIGIASLTALSSDLSKYNGFGEISSIKYAIIILNFLLQGFIAWRAFLDQTLSDVKKEEQPSQSIDIPKVSDK